MPNVYITNASCHDFEPARKFGDLVFLSMGLFKRSKVSEMYRVMYEKLQHSGPEDCLLITGMTIMNVVAAGILSAKHKRLNLLIFEPSIPSRYLKRELIIGGNNDEKGLRKDIKSSETGSIERFDNRGINSARVRNSTQRSTKRSR